MNFDVISQSGWIFYVVSTAAVVLLFLSGYNWGAAREKKQGKILIRNLQKKLSHTQSQVNVLTLETKTAKKKLIRYRDFVIRIPDAVKNINSNLSFNDLITAIIRLVRELIQTEEVEVYMYNRQNKSLKLVAASGTNRGRSLVFQVGDGVIGSAAETQMMSTRSQLEINSRQVMDDKIETAMPIIFKGELLGVIGIGKISKKTEDDKRFLAMTTDIAAVAFKNCESLDDAKEKAVKDALTGLYNKQYFYDMSLEAIRKCSNYDFSFSILLFDIDNFKHYNDTNGHVQGDVLLKELGELIRKNTRSTNIIARYGGEEFIVLLQNTDKVNATKFGDNLREKIASYPFAFREKQPLGCVSISGGVAEFPIDGDTVEEIIKRADEALYESKRSGKNRITEYKSTQLSSEPVS